MTQEELNCVLDPTRGLVSRLLGLPVLIDSGKRPPWQSRSLDNPRDGPCGIIFVEELVIDFEKTALSQKSHCTFTGVTEGMTHVDEDEEEEEEEGEESGSREGNRRQAPHAGNHSGGPNVSVTLC